ncbi:hypothetical protein [Streptomyces phage Verabelle]|uniref:Uncharacterized protein n=1 Tax=Streptomyces phage Verabelle TaxID=3065247 RepID=A0AA50IBJ1_9CAUD|nr:hypothetical protein [Streptomyces phage Verabelle]
MRELTVTIKYGKGYEETWAVFKGNPDEVREDIISYFGLMRDSVTELTLSELVVEVTSLAHGKGNIARFLGGTIIPPSEAGPDPAPAASSNEDPWAAASSSTPSAPAAQPAEDPNAYILGEIEKQADVAGLKRLWAENQNFFSDPAVMAAWKAKGKALSAK